MTEAETAHVDCDMDRRFSGGTAMIRGYGSMTSFSMVLVVWFTGVSLGKRPIMATTLFLDRDRAKVSATLSGRLGKNSAEAAIDGDHALIGARLCQTQRSLQPIGKNSRGNRQ